MTHSPLESFAHGLLPVSQGNAIYWETSGNPHGQPLSYLHGGLEVAPGPVATGDMRTHLAT